MTSVARRGELVKLSRLLGQPPEALGFLAALEVPQLRAVRDAISARLFDDARPVLQRVATGAKLLPNSLTARVGEAVFGSTLCAQIAGLLSTSHALDLALKMSNGFLAEVSAMIDPRRAGAVISQIPTDRVVAVAHIMLERQDYVTLARFVDFLSTATIAAVIDSIPDELELLRIGAYVESAPKLGELVGLLSPERVRAMIAALRGADGIHWMEALAIAEQLDDAWRRTLGDHAVWPAALLLILAMSEPSQRRFLELPILDRPEIVNALVAAAATVDRWPEMQALVARMPEARQPGFAAALRKA